MSAPAREEILTSLDLALGRIVECFGALKAETEDLQNKYADVQISLQTIGLRDWKKRVLTCTTLAHDGKDVQIGERE